MTNIQKALDALQPYVIGIRYSNGMVLVDVVFKDGWIVPDDKLVKKEKGDQAMNYYMLYSDSPNIGLDEILTYVETTIKLNLEKEKKYDLLKSKVDELKDLFKKNSLTKLKNLRFTFDEQLIPDINELNLDIDDIVPEEYEEEILRPNIPPTYLDENNKPIDIPLTEEDREILEEEARAERNRDAIKNKKIPTKKTMVELPPRKEEKVIEPIYYNDGICSCSENEACEKCIDTK